MVVADIGRLGSDLDIQAIVQVTCRGPDLDTCPGVNISGGDDQEIVKLDEAF